MLWLPTIPDPLDIWVQSDNSCDFANYGSFRIEASVELMFVDGVERDKSMFSDYLPIRFVYDLRTVVISLNYLAKAAAVNWLAETTWLLLLHLDRLLNSLWLPVRAIKTVVVNFISSE